MSHRDVFVVSTARTAIGTFGGSLKDVPNTQLATTAVRAPIARPGIAPDAVAPPPRRPPPTSTACAAQACRPSSRPPRPSSSATATWPSAAAARA